MTKRSLLLPESLCPLPPFSLYPENQLRSRISRNRFPPNQGQMTPDSRHLPPPVVIWRRRFQVAKEGEAEAVTVILEGVRGAEVGIDEIAKNMKFVKERVVVTVNLARNVVERVESEMTDSPGQVRTGLALGLETLNGEATECELQAQRGVSVPVVAIEYVPQALPPVTLNSNYGK